MIEKECSKCKTIWPIEQFSKDKYNKDGYTSQCKSCRRANTKLNEESNLKKHSNLSMEQIRKLTPNKKCPSCKKQKVSSEYAIDRKTKTGLYSYCSECMRKRCTDYDNRNREKHRKYSQEYTIKSRMSPQHRYKQYKRGANNRNHDFEITMDEFLTFWKKPCNYCGADIDSVGLDRIDNAQGYVLSNLCSCCFDCNQMKSTRDLKSWIGHLTKIIEHFQEK